ncbi:hypothetical protein C8J95_102316 [Elizabethkingia sp. YR214]|nr:hypothetical protein [Elizabethkingia sp. YR214]PUB34651.1 hypothetical protein C8J95_102316 [Elizabethkingia sp. YR214]
MKKLKKLKREDLKKVNGGETEIVCPPRYVYVSCLGVCMNGRKWVNCPG